MYFHQTQVKPYTNSMIKIVLFVCGLLVGGIVGLYMAAQFFPLSTSETVYIRGVEQ